MTTRMILRLKVWYFELVLLYWIWQRKRIIRTSVSERHPMTFDGP